MPTRRAGQAGAGRARSRDQGRCHGAPGRRCRGDLSGDAENGRITSSTPRSRGRRRRSASRSCPGRTWRYPGGADHVRAPRPGGHPIVVGGTIPSDDAAPEELGDRHGASGRHTARSGRRARALAVAGDGARDRRTTGSPNAARRVRRTRGSRSHRCTRAEDIADLDAARDLGRPVTRRSPAAPTRRCIGDSCGRCASTPDSAPPQTPTPASASCWPQGRPHFGRFRSPDAARVTTRTNAGRVRGRAGWGWPSTPSTTWWSCSTASPWTSCR